jgi:Plasmid pRiA4b ORF-3-like protein
VISGCAIDAAWTICWEIHLPLPQKASCLALRIELQDVTPLVWRRVLVPSNWTLANLHPYLQWVMAWSDTHAHEFQVREGMIAPDWWIREMTGNVDHGAYRDERDVSVAEVAAELGVRGEFEYRYDMGDDWRLRIVVDTLPVGVIADSPLPRCVAGENAGPPDDVGGSPGYAEFLGAIADRHNERHEEMLRWIGGVFDPKGFDLNRLNSDWKAPKARRR